MLKEFVQFNETMCLFHFFQGSPLNMTGTFVLLGEEETSSSPKLSGCRDKTSVN